MGLKIVSFTEDAPLRKSNIFVSSSIPDPGRWRGDFDSREITDAVVAAARAILTAGGVIVTGAHPTISPLLLYVAAEFPIDPDQPHVIVYQSGLFERVMPEATKRFQDFGVGYLRLTKPVRGDKPTPGRWNHSLRIMREQMFAETRPVAGIYIGGMADITTEFEMLNAMRPQPQAYALAAPGGEAATLVERSSEPMRDLLAHSNIYPTIFHNVIQDVISHIDTEL